MEEALKTAAVLAYGYLLGSVPTAYLAGRFVKGIDLRKVGSGTMGAANVWYHVGRGWIFPVGLFDMLVKGMTPAFVARALDLDLGVQAVAGLLAIIGHNWPVFLGFKGGRGVAPTMGVLLALGRLEIAAFMVIGTAGWRLTGGSPFWILLGLMMLPFFSLFWGRPASIVLLMVGILGVTVLKRLMSNSLRGTGVGFGRLMLNRLIYDRDIADHDAWVARGEAAAGE